LIIKPPSNDPLPSDFRRRAGAEAERQMAFYLHRAYANDQDLYILNDLRLVDPAQPEPDGSPGVCQIDHLVLHRWGAFIIESKSVTDEVTVSADTSGGDEWTRRFNGRDQGFASPIQQARRQAHFLRKLLHENRTNLLGKVPTGLRTIVKLVAGSDQYGFANLPIQIIVAISDNGKIRRINKWTEPTKPFRSYVCKADTVVDKITTEWKLHRAASNPLAKRVDDYGLWSMKADEVSAVAAFLLEQHTPLQIQQPTPQSTPISSPPREAPPDPRPVPAVAPPSEQHTTTPAPAPQPPKVSAAPASPAAATPAPASKPSPSQRKPACKSCNSASLTAMWGKYGYYWKCNDCASNTTMPTTCSLCGTAGKQGQTVRIRKDGPRYFRRCEPCGIEEVIWTQ